MKKINRKKISIINFLKPFLVFLIIFLVIFFFYKYNENNYTKKTSIKIIENFSQNYNYLLKNVIINKLNNIESLTVKNLFSDYFNNSIFLVPIKNISYKISLINWVDDVIIKNDFKNTIKVTIIEKKPAGIYIGNNNLLFDNNSKVIDFISINNDNYSELIKFKGKNSLINANTLLDFIPKSLVNSVSEAIFVGERRWDIILKNGLYLKLSENNISESFVNFNEIYKNISNDELKNIESIDLRMQNKAILKFINQKND